MTVLFTLSFIASFILMLVYPPLYILLSRCRAFGFNRLVVLACLATVAISASLLYYLITDTGPVTQGIYADTIIDFATSTTTFPPTTSSAPQALFLTSIIPAIILPYCIGMVILVIRRTISYFQLYGIIRNSCQSKVDGVVVCRHGSSGFSPFSWGKYVVLPDGSNDSAVITHEKAHISRRHWIDVFLVDMFCILLWYNPFIWLIKRLVKLNHEYEADEAVINSNVDILSYQRLLITQAIGRRRHSVVNNFATSSHDFRCRVLAMDSRGSRRKGKWLLVSLLPALTLAIGLCTTPLSATIVKTFSSSRNPSLVSDSSQNEIANASGISPIEKRGDVGTEKLLPSPLTDPEPLRKRFKVSFDMADKELLPDRLLVYIEVAEDGSIISANTNHDDNTNVRSAVEKAIDGIRFDVVIDNGRNIKTIFALPIHLTGRI